MKARIVLGCTALALAAATATSVVVPRASAAPGNVTGVTRVSAALPRPNISAAAAPSWQTNNTVWALAYSSGVEYAGGQFTSVRPPGAKPGTGEVARSYLAAFNSSTGALVTSFDPVITGGSGPEVLALAVSGHTLYIGGSFTHVDGQYRDNLAALDLTTGALTGWAPAAFGKVRAIAPAPNGSEIYIGGDFNQLAGKTVTFAGAVDASGAAQAWAPSLNNSVNSIAVAPDDSRVLVGGDFQTINGVTQNAIGSTDPASGQNEPWAATIVPYDPPGCSSAVKDIVISGSTAYVSAEGTGGGCFDGDFAANVSDGRLIWQNDCLGATQALVVISGWLYKGSHAHDCAYNAGGFPQQPVNKAYHLLDQSLTDGTIGHWTPDTNATGLGPRALATDGSQLFLGGDFTVVNGRLQQGLARFGAGPDLARPASPAAPTVMSTSKGVDSVTFTAISTPDVGRLIYKIYRDNGKRSIRTLAATSWPWALPVLHFRDARLRPGSRHTYRVGVSDGSRYSLKSPPSVPVTVSSRNPSHSYQRRVLLDKPSFFWLLDQRSGSSAVDSSPHHFNGSYESGIKLRAPGPIAGSRATATSFNGSTGLVTSVHRVASPSTFSIDGWFKTTTNKGGMLIGFGNARTGASSAYDRHIYMMNDGQLVFGIWDGKAATIESPNVYNDGQWHYVAATLGSQSGAYRIALYVDGRLIGTAATSADQAYAGYWRVGGDNLNGWNLDEWHTNSQGTTQPNSYYFGGSIGDVAVYPYVLSAKEVARHYAANLLEH